MRKGTDERGAGASSCSPSKRQTPDRDEVDALVRDYRKCKEAEAKLPRRAGAGNEGCGGDAFVRRSGTSSPAKAEAAAALRDRLIAQHLYLVQTAARKFTGLGESHEDLLQEGAMGLINAVDLYDPDRGVQFSTYATHLVEGQIRHYLRDRGKLIKQPAWVQELTTKIVKATEMLTQQLNRSPLPEEVAESVGTTPENVRRMLEARERSKVASLDAARDQDDEQGPAIDPDKLRVEESEGLHLPVEDRIFLREAMSRLKELERRVVHNFYYLDLNQTEIARKLGISVNYASYLLRGAVAKLKKAFEAQEHAARAQQESLPPQTPSIYSLSARPAPSDPLTKVATQAYLAERVEQEVLRASRYPQQFAVVLVEPDLPAGPDPIPPTLDPAVLVELARLLRGNCRSIDLVGRIGGGRFALLLPHTGREAGVLSERVCRTAEARLGGQSGSRRDLTVSVGYAVFPTDGRTGPDLFGAADQAVLQAKQAGGNRAQRAPSRGLGSRV